MIILISVMLSLILYALLRKRISSKYLVPILMIVPLITIPLSNGFLFFAFKSATEKAYANDNSVLDMYGEDLTTTTEVDISELFEKAIVDETESGFDQSPEYELGDEIGDGSESLQVSPISAEYQNTLDAAKRLEGSTLLHEVHNLVVKTAEDFKDTYGFTYEYIMGTNITESNGTRNNPFLPNLGAPAVAIQLPTFNLFTWSYKDLFEWMPKAEAGFSHGGNDSYIGAFQVDFRRFNSNESKKPVSGWGKEQWYDFVETSGTESDGNGDGLSDPFNFYDQILGMAKHAKGKPILMKERYVNPGPGEQEMKTMLLAARYVGTSAKYSTKNLNDGTLSAHNEWDKYVHVEGKNPHVNFFRAAVNEWLNNGPIYTEYKTWMEGQTTTSSNGDNSAKIINKLYAQEGWEKGTTSGKASQRWYHPDGTYTAITGQDIHYAVRVLWGGKVMKENIEKRLSSQ